MENQFTIYNLDVFSALKKIQEEKILVDCIVTSPPYWGLRNYKVEGQIGLEEHPQEYIDKIVSVFEEVKKVLAPHGTLFLNLGDSYYSQSGSGRIYENIQEDAPDLEVSEHRHNIRGKFNDGGWLQPKQRLMIPERIAIKMQENGWILRNDIIWHKKNFMPSSVKDRLTNSYEHIYFFVQQRHYFFDLDSIRVPIKQENIEREQRGVSSTHKNLDSTYKTQSIQSIHKPRLNIKKIQANAEELTNREQNLKDFFNLKGSGGNPVPGISGSTLGMKEGNHPLGKNPSDFFSDDPTDILETTLEPFSDAHFACLSEDTECLTENGWKKYNELKLIDKIASFNITTEKIEFCIPQKIWIYDFEGDLIRIENKWIDNLITLNHRVLLKYVHSPEKRIIEKNWRFVEAQDLSPFSGIRFPVASYYDGDWSIGKPLASVLGWVLSEGWYEKKCGVIGIAQSLTKNSKNCELIEEALTKSKILFSKYVGNKKWKNKKYIELSFRIPRREAHKIKNLLPDKKTPPFSLFKLIREERQTLFDSFCLGDAHLRKDGRIHITQKEKTVIDFIRLLAFSLGKRTFLSYNKTRNIWYLFITNRLDCQIHQKDFKNCYKQQKFFGKVWCVTISNSAFVVKRNEKIFITGNCFPRKIPRFCIKVGCAKQVCIKCGKPKIKIVGMIQNEPKENYTGQAQKDYKNTKAQNPSDTKRRILESMTKKIIKEEWVAGCNCGTGYLPGIVLDPFVGSGTTLQVAQELSLQGIGIELNEKYVDLIKKRILGDKEQSSLFPNKLKIIKLGADNEP